MPSELVLASGNAGKLRELAALLGDLPVRVRAQSDFGVSEAVEDGLSFVENALIKARHASAETGLAAIADDSGIAVDALGGEPGIHSARYAGDDATDAANLDKLLTAMAEVPDPERACRFICVAVYLRHARDPLPLIYSAEWRGRLLHAAVGTAGFGYDPIFWVATHRCSSAELPAAVKNRISHRAQAFAQLATALRLELSDRE